MIDPFEHPEERCLVLENTGQQRCAMFLLDDLSSLQPLLPALVQVPFDAERDVHVVASLVSV
jgi:hypothetical protein